MKHVALSRSVPGHWLSWAALAALAMLGAPRAQADDFQVSGFLTLAGGRTFGAAVDPSTLSLSDRFSDRCPCFIADWGHAGVYGPSWSLRPESRVGVQLNYDLTPEWHITGQTVARAVPGYRPDLEWAYVTYSGLAGWTFQVGRKRLPLYDYSDYQDVGYAYSWIRPPADVYGWDVVNYNGASASWSGSVHGFQVRASGYAGGETSKQNLYSRLIYGKDEDPLTVKWSGIIGGDVSAEYKGITARLAYMKSDYSDSLNPDKVPQKTYGGSLNAELGDWTVRSEFSKFDRTKQGYVAKAMMVSAAYRIGEWTPHLTWSRYRESSTLPTYNPVRTQTWSLGLRRELTPQSSLKVQFDKTRDSGVTADGTARSLYAGSARAISVAYDQVF